MTTTSTLSDRIRKIDLRHPETLDIFELRAAVESALEDVDFPEIERADLEEAFDRFDMLGLRKAIVDAERFDLSVPSSPADVISQLDDVRSSFESIAKNIFDNAQDFAPVTRKDLADLEKRVVAAEKAAKKATAKKAPARKRPAAKKAAAKKS